MTTVAPPELRPDEMPVPVPTESLDELPRWSKAIAITVDGPAGSGKSTIARRLAERLGYQYIDTGATYRALAWLALERDIPLDDAARLRGLAIAQPVSLFFRDGRWTVRIAGTDVTDEIREPRIDDAASKVARHPEVRDVMIGRQRQLSRSRDTVLDGRDCGTHVRPDADYKVFATADFDERVRRRTAQFSDAGDQGQVASAIRERDERDAPQSGAAPDAVTFDTSDVGVEEVVDRIVEGWLERRRELFDDEVVAGRTARDWYDVDVQKVFDKWYRATAWAWRGMFRLEVHGIARVPERNCLFLANHSSVWDPAFLTVPLKRPIRFMAKVELMSHPIIKHMADGIGCFPVRRGHGDRVALHIAEQVLRRGDSLGIFPEGTRIYEDRLARPRQGAARLALVTGVPVVPTAIYGTQYSESAGKVFVAFGKPMDFSDLPATPDNIAFATERVWEEVEELWLALRARVKG